MFAEAHFNRMDVILYVCACVDSRCPEAQSERMDYVRTQAFCVSIHDERRSRCGSHITLDKNHEISNECPNERGKSRKRIKIHQTCYKGWYTSALQHYYAAPQKTETDNLTTEIIKMSLHQEGEELHSAIGK